MTLDFPRPMLIHPPHLADARGGPLNEVQGPNGGLAKFLQDLGPAVMEKYKPKAIVVLSAHWESPGGGIVTDYGDQNPLLFDYFGFPDEVGLFSASGRRYIVLGRRFCIDMCTDSFLTALAAVRGRV